MSVKCAPFLATSLCLWFGKLRGRLAVLIGIKIGDAMLTWRYQYRFQPCFLVVSMWMSLFERREVIV